jgi:hypothetical protein
MKCSKNEVLGYCSITDDEYCSGAVYICTVCKRIFCSENKKQTGPDHYHKNHIGEYNNLCNGVIVNMQQCHKFIYNPVGHVGLNEVITPCSGVVAVCETCGRTICEVIRYQVQESHHIVKNNSLGTPGCKGRFIPIQTVQAQVKSVTVVNTDVIASELISDEQWAKYHGFQSVNDYKKHVKTLLSSTDRTVDS